MIHFPDERMDCGPKVNPVDYHFHIISKVACPKSISDELQVKSGQTFLIIACWLQLSTEASMDLFPPESCNSNCLAWRGERSKELFQVVI